MPSNKKPETEQKNTEKTTKDYKTRIRRLGYKDKKKSVKINEPIPSSLSILMASIKHVWLNKKLFFGIMIVYSLLYLLLVKGLATNFQLPDTKQAITDAGTGLDTLTTGSVLLGSLVGTIGSTSSESAAVYQVVLFIFISLVLIWSLRQTYGKGIKIKVRQSFYSSMYPLVQYILVWLVVSIQLIPAVIGLTLYGIVSSNGIAVGALENILWLILTAILIGLSVFYVSSSLFASYIVTLPDMTPMLALKKAKKVVKFRRFAIIRKLLFFPFVAGIITVLIFFPLVLYLTVLAEVLFIVFTILLILLGHSYFYNLYKKLL